MGESEDDMAAKSGRDRVRQFSRPASAPRSEVPLSIERIVTTAVEVLDAEGVEGLTMRRLAERLGAGAMSVYWHVGNKEAVFDLALDAVLAYQPPARSETGAGDWRADIVHMLEDWRGAMLRHPWSATLLPRRALGPNMLGRLDLLSRTLSAAGVADDDLNVAIWSLWNFVMGATVTRGNFERTDEERAAAQQHLTEYYPAIGRSRLLLDSDWDGAFRKGLDLLLDGIAPKTLTG